MIPPKYELLGNDLPRSALSSETDLRSRFFWKHNIQMNILVMHIAIAAGCCVAMKPTCRLR